jgi:hypothetical protein
MNEAEVNSRVDKIHDRVLGILQHAAAEGAPPARVADAKAEALLMNARQTGAA